MADLSIIKSLPEEHRNQTNQQRRDVQFANKAQITVVERHEDYEENNVARHELWYTEADYHRMKLAIIKSVLEVRQKLLAGTLLLSLSYSDSGDDSSEDCIECLTGIEHLLGLVSASVPP